MSPNGVKMSCSCGWEGPHSSLKKIDFDEDKVTWICCPKCHPFILRRLEECTERPTPMLACGDAATGVKILKGHNGISCCPAHAGLVDGRDTMVTRFPDLKGRKARCTLCGNTRKSDMETCAFFRYRGPGSHAASLRCDNCGHHKLKHNDKEWVEANCPDGFKPHKGLKQDEFYDGCRGWD